MKKILLFTQSGQSLTQVLISIGLLGAASVGFMQYSRNMTRGQVTTETRMESLEIKRIMTTTLLDKAACQKTFLNKKIGDQIDSIRTGSGLAVFEAGKTYNQETVKILSMRTQDLGAVSTEARNVNFIVELEKVKKDAYGNLKNIIIPLTVGATSATDAIGECFAQVDQTLKLACESLGGTWNANRCDLPKCLGNEVLQGINADGTAICGSPNCPLDKMLVGMTTDGQPICAAPLAGKSCPAGQTLVGIDAQGQVLCQMSVNNKSCPPNQYMAGVGTNGSPICKSSPAGKSCPGGQVMSGIGNDGDPICVASSTDRRCPTGQYMAGINANGALICETLPDAPVPNTNCIGSWGACSEDCGGGTQTFSITQDASGSGSTCSATHGQTRSCNNQKCPVYCQDQTVSWSSVINVSGFVYENGKLAPGPQNMNVTCSGAVSKSSEGASVTATSTSPKGSAKFHCGPDGNWSKASGEVCCASNMGAACSIVSSRKNLTGGRFTGSAQNCQCQITRPADCPFPGDTGPWTGFQCKDPSKFVDGGSCDADSSAGFLCVQENAGFIQCDGTCAATPPN